MAVRERKRIFIDFTAQNNAACRSNELNVFTHPLVARELKKYVCLHLFTDVIPSRDLTPAQSKEQARKQREWQIGMVNTIASPMYVIFEPDRTQAFDESGVPKGRVIAQTSGLIQDVQKFQKFLENP